MAGVSAPDGSHPEVHALQRRLEMASEALRRVATEHDDATGPAQARPIGRLALLNGTHGVIDCCLDPSRRGLVRSAI